MQIIHDQSINRIAIENRPVHFWHGNIQKICTKVKRCLSSCTQSWWLSWLIRLINEFACVLLFSNSRPWWSRTGRPHRTQSPLLWHLIPDNVLKQNTRPACQRWSCHKLKHADQTLTKTTNCKWLLCIYTQIISERLNFPMNRNLNFSAQNARLVIEKGVQMYV